MLKGLRWALAELDQRLTSQFPELHDFNDQFIPKTAPLYNTVSVNCAGHRLAFGEDMA
ncbi:hypothetical protein ACFSTD_17220 [Novosphingobium colocasiae]|uniref:hypothetical protein n=1 Tax=Novosphingobium colocasiae TaxID=1256513 RepID=UPI0016790819|nr:hypothetical protein [Novosphingobium colocasiae]